MNGEKAKMLAERVLQDPENDLADILRAFRSSGDRVWHIDRHVLDVNEAMAPDPDTRVGACAAGLGLLRKWYGEIPAEGSSDLFVSKPYLIIDDEWLEGGSPHAPPPHVYICLSRDGGAMAVEHEQDRVRSIELSGSVTELLAEGETFYRISGAFEDEPGAWVIKIGTSPMA